MSLQLRPPIVTMMGHVDHGKTSLLDAIRKTSVVTGEAGGITQHIGAYTVSREGKTITFLDTPGHAAFSKMRSRGAHVTDIVVLVVSSVEGVKPQTVESIQHIKKASVSYLVALTKTDLPESNPEMVKAQLTEHEVFVEGYGGDIVVVPVSAKTGEGLDKLLEMISLLAEIAELQADPSGALEAIVIESQRDAHRGVVATVLVKTGTLRTGDTIYTPETKGKVRALTTAEGLTVKEAGPSIPVQVLGWEDIPLVGSIVTTTFSSALAAVQTPENVTGSEQTVSESVNKLNIILKSDVAGTLEAVEQSVTAQEVQVVSKGVGEITETDVLLAEATHSVIFGFHVKLSPAVKKVAENLGVKIKVYAIIYDLIEEIQKQVLRLIEPTIDEEELGKAQVIALFEMKGERIAGCKVLSGEITKTQLYHIKRNGVIIADPRIKSMKHGKLDIESAKTGVECGIVLRGFNEAQIGDELVAYRMKEE